MGRIVSGLVSASEPDRSQDGDPRGPGLPGSRRAWQGADMATAPTLTDGTVTLRAHRESDAQGAFEQCQDPDSQRWTTVPLPYTFEDAVAFVTEIMPTV